MTTNLSILICTIAQRKLFFNRLMGQLDKIKVAHDDVEILHENDFALMSIGEKRNLLVNRAKGKFACFIDDDDYVDTNYLNYIMPIIRNKDVDGIGFKGLIYTNNTAPKTFIHKHGNEFKEENGLYLRPLNHLNPVRTELMRKVPFLHLSHAEDTDYATRITPLIKEVEFIDEYLYYYYYRPLKTEMPRHARRG